MSVEQATKPTVTPSTGARTLGDMFLRAASTYPGTALRYRLDGRWVDASYAELGSRDDRPYIVALIKLDAYELPALAEKTGSQLASDERMRAEIRREVDAVNERFVRIEQVKRFHIHDRDLSQADGELTPTLKVKRAIVYRRFADVLNRLYD